MILPVYSILVSMLIAIVHHIIIIIMFPYVELCPSYKVVIVYNYVFIVVGMTYVGVINATRAMFTNRLLTKHNIFILTNFTRLENASVYFSSALQLVLKNEILVTSSFTIPFFDFKFKWYPIHFYSKFKTTVSNSSECTANVNSLKKINNNKKNCSTSAGVAATAGIVLQYMKRNYTYKKEELGLLNTFINTSDNYVYVAQSLITRCLVCFVEGNYWHCA
ncbi:hypothetical protein AGLY_009725, partial [Aphis glycines]